MQMTYLDFGTKDHNVINELDFFAVASLNTTH